MYSATEHSSKSTARLGKALHVDTFRKSSEGPCSSYQVSRELTDKAGLRTMMTFLCTQHRRNEPAIVKLRLLFQENNPISTGPKRASFLDLPKRKVFLISKKNRLLWLAPAWSPGLVSEGSIFPNVISRPTQPDWITSCKTFLEKPSNISFQPFSETVCM